ncbi:MAG: EamA family transporter [Verrucomicrobia bacterium]|nr:MAG: EamA family transporter [Verrucomicrobiota bacterium]
MALNSSKDRSIAVTQLILAALAWSLGGLLIKSIDWAPLAVAGARGLLAGTFLILITRPLHFTFTRPQVLGALGYALCTVTFCTATKLTTAANAILLQYTAPVWIALLGSWLLKEKATRKDWVTILFVLAGMLLFFKDGLQGDHLLGDTLAALSGLFFAGMTIALRRQKDGSPVESIILGNYLAFLIGLPWIVHSSNLSSKGWISLLLLGVVQLGLSYGLYAKAIRHVTALEAVIIPVIEPILNPIWVLIAVGEKPSLLSILGGVVVLTAVTVRAISTTKINSIPVSLET